MKRISYIVLGLIIGAIFGPAAAIFGAIIGFFSHDFFNGSPNHRCEPSLPKVKSSFTDHNDADGSHSSSTFDTTLSDIPMSTQAGIAPTIDAMGMDILEYGDAQLSILTVNPANGLPMIGDCIGGIDIEGNVYGTDSSDINSDFGLARDSGSSFDMDSSMDWSSMDDSLM